VIVRSSGVRKSESFSLTPWALTSSVRISKQHLITRLNRSVVIIHVESLPNDPDTAIAS
jgi:hypothetical protein